MLNYVQGDILQGVDIENGKEHTLILHGCNCFHTMGSGIAKYLRSKFPGIYEADVKTTAYGDRYKLGTCSSFHVNHYIRILNCYTQFKFLPRDVVNADYKAIERCFDMISHSYSGQVWKIRMPKIGCGLAGGDWNIVEKLVKENLDEFNVTVYYL